jgi:predicted protein tyrosine phosphatase
VVKAKRVLFVCEGNLHRSPTAQRLYSSTPGIQARSAGLSGLARVQVTDELLSWADVVFVMERRLGKLLRRRFSEALEGKELVCLEVPDDYQLQQPELVAVLTERLAPHLGQPVLGSATEVVEPFAATDRPRDHGSTDITVPPV